MVIDMKQTRLGVNANFIFSTENNPNVYQAYVRLCKGSPDIDLMQKDVPILKLNSDEILTGVKGIFYREKLLSYIKKPNGDICGEVSLKIAHKLMTWYKYIQINYNAELLNCYEVKMGKEGTFICIYLGDIQIAMIEISTICKDDMNFCKIYVKKNKYIEIVCLYAVYHNYLALRSDNESNKESYEYTLNKKLKSKYNPKFKEGC